MSEELIIPDSSIKDRIHTIRGVQVMLDSDLAELYGVETKQLNRAVKRNIERFPKTFMFRLDASEYGSLKSQFATSGEDSLRSQNTPLEKTDKLRFQNGTSSHGGRRYLPYAFTEQGVSMLSGVLKSRTAVKVSIQIINAFVAMRRFLSQNADVFRRLDCVERKQLAFETETEKNFEKVFEALQTERPKQGIFYNGQVFDAHRFISDLIRSAKESIILIDNYIDDSVLTLFTKRKPRVKATIYTKISRQLKLDLRKYDSQHKSITIKEFKDSHDRFMIIDNKEVYHIGASLKDLGKKWFAFSRFDKKALDILSRLEKSE